MTQLFKPIAGGTKSLSAGVTTGTVSLSSAGEACSKIRVYNSGMVTVFVEFGSGTTTASITTSMPIAPGAVELFDKSTDAEAMAAITASGTSTVYFTPGEGE